MHVALQRRATHTQPACGGEGTGPANQLARLPEADMAGCYEFVVIGSGPSGRRAAIQAAQLGHSVPVIECRMKVGGESVLHGTIPSTTLSYTAVNTSAWRARCFYACTYRA